MAAAKHQAQLDWEKRGSVSVAIAALVGGILMVQVPFLQRAALIDDRKGVEATPDYLLSLHDHTNAFLVSAIAEAVGVLLLGWVLYFLFRAIRYRSPELPEFFKWLVIIGPILYALSSVIGIIEASNVADKFAAAGPIDGKAGDNRADDLLKDISPIAIALQFAGHLSIAFMYVMLGVRGMRAGLLSRFMGILAIIIGALLVLPLLPQQVVQLFWLGAFAALVLDYWPNGRGPAWSTGEAEPWPAPTRRSLGAPREQADGGPAADEPEDPSERPPSRKRKRKR